jgi:hypothetical protein
MASRTSLFSSDKRADFLNKAVGVDDEAASKFAKDIDIAAVQMADKKSIISSIGCLSKKDKAAVGRCQ